MLFILVVSFEILGDGKFLTRVNPTTKNCSCIQEYQTTSNNTTTEGTRDKTCANMSAFESDTTVQIITIVSTRKSDSPNLSLCEVIVSAGALYGPLLGV